MAWIAERVGRSRGLGRAAAGGGGGGSGEMVKGWVEGRVRGDE